MIILELFLYPVLLLTALGLIAMVAIAILFFDLLNKYLDEEYDNEDKK
jgi:hypothetical protein